MAINVWKEQSIAKLNVNIAWIICRFAKRELSWIERELPKIIDAAGIAQFTLIRATFTRIRVPPKAQKENINEKLMVDQW